MRTKRLNNAANRAMELGKSPNAIRAENQGLFVKEDIKEEVLQQLGFAYPKIFFQWLCEKGYIKPMEYHHKGFTKDGRGLKIAAYYSLLSITYAVEHFDLDFLYRLYMGTLSYNDALKEKDIRFCRVKSVSELVGIAHKAPVVADCVKQKKTIWFSKRKYIKMHHDRIQILAEWDIRPNDFKNPNTRKIIRMLFSRTV